MNPYSLFYAVAFLIFVPAWAALSLVAQQPLWIAWLGAASVSALVLCGFDKSAARRSSMRVPERVLLVIALLGGSLGLLLGMNIFRHKTRKISFQFLVLACLIAQVITLRYITSH